MYIDKSTIYFNIGKQFARAACHTQ